MRLRLNAIWSLVLLLAYPVQQAGSVAVPGEPPVLLLPKVALGAGEIGVVVNMADPDSISLGRYYLDRRGIPDKNLIQVRFRPGRRALTASEFAPVLAELRRQTPAEVQAYALMWTEPYRVGCMSVTSAVALGYDTRYCANGCAPTQTVAYYGHPTQVPYADLGLRPAMLVAGRNPDAARALIDRGVAADGTRPTGTAYLVSTRDAARNVRARTYPAAQAVGGRDLRVQIIETDALVDRSDVLVYLTGGSEIAGIDRNRYLPGAVADHLTSTGGQLTNSRQMSALRWLDAGVTGSYGTVVEPCNFPGKFPDPPVLLRSYLEGATLIEAYWKSVSMPGQGVFVGEPLARPFAGGWLTRDHQGWRFETRALPGGRYELEASFHGVGPYRSVNGFQHRGGTRVVVRLPEGQGRFYRIVRD